jgi:tyrosine-protein kinase Etk/Wzc
MAVDVSSSKLQEHADVLDATSAVAPVTGNDETSLLDLLVVLAERKRIILAVTTAFALVAIIISFVLPRRYTATVTLMPPQQSSSMSAALASQLGSMGGMAALASGSLGLKNANEMFVSMLRSRTVEDAMIQHFGLMQEYHAKFASDARRALERHVTVNGSGKDSLIRISVEDPDPRHAADLANGYVDQFRIQSQHLAITEASQRRLFFEQQLEQAKDNLSNAEEALKQTEQKTGVIQLDSQARALIESAASLRAQVAAKEVQIQGMRTYATGENFQIVQAQQELDSMRAQLARLGGSENNASGELIVPKGQVPEAGLEYIRKLRDVKYNETIFDILARQFEAAKLDEARQGALIQVVDPAVPPDIKSFPKRGRIVIGATIAGLLIGILVAFFQIKFKQMMDDPEAAQKLRILCRQLSISGLGVMGSKD